MLALAGAAKLPWPWAAAATGRTGAHNRHPRATLVGPPEPLTELPGGTSPLDGAETQSEHLVPGHACEHVDRQLAVHGDNAWEPHWPSTSITRSSRPVVPSLALYFAFIMCTVVMVPYTPAAEVRLPSSPNAASCATM